MIRAAIFDKATGVILQIVTADARSIMAALEPGQDAMFAPDDVDDSTHYVVGIEFRAYPPKPGPTFTWDAKTFTWIETRNLAQLQAAKWERVKAAREAACSLPVNTALGVFDANAAARDNLSKTVLAMQMTNTNATRFTLNDNARVDVTLPQLVLAGARIFQQVQAAYERAATLRTQILAAQDAATLAAIPDS